MRHESDNVNVKRQDDWLWINIKISLHNGHIDNISSRVLCLCPGDTPLYEDIDMWGAKRDGV